LRRTDHPARWFPATAAAALVFSLAASGQTTHSLAEINARRTTDFGPRLEGETVVVRGVVSSEPIRFPYFTHLAIQDHAGNGLVLEGAATKFAQLRPGNLVEVRGTVSKRAGLPVVLPAALEILSRGPAPEPRPMHVANIQSLRHLGLLVVTEGRVLERGENTGGEYLVIGDDEQALKVFLPQAEARTGGPSLEPFEVGDRIRVTGVASQYCPFPPYNRFYQLTISSSDSVVLLRKRWLISPESFLVSLAALALALGVWWMRERRMAAHRRMVRSFYSLGEEIIGARSPLEIRNRLASTLPGMLKASGINLYLHSRTKRALECVPSASEPQGFAVPLHSPEGSLPIGAAACFRNQALLMIPDTRRSPFFPDGRRGGPPKAITFVPMFAENELLGVLEIFNFRTQPDLSADERVLVQHLANQIAIALRLAEEKTIREQLFRSEKLAAVGQLISGVAAELKSPLERITALAGELDAPPQPELHEDIAAISSEAHKASEIVGRLVSFLDPERTEARRVELNTLLRSLLRFRRQEWEARGFQVTELLCPAQALVLGSQGQLERVFLDLLIQVEQWAAESPEKALTISTSVLARRVLVEIQYGAASLKSGRNTEALEAGPAVDSVARGILRSHGGEIRVARGSDECRLEVDLPLAPAQVAADEAGSLRVLTCLVVDPDPGARNELVMNLTNRGCRVIPAGSAEEGHELVERMRFDTIFCALRLPGLNWVEFSRLISPQVGSFVLLTEGYDLELSRGLDGNTQVLMRPFEEATLDQMLATVAARLATAELPARGLQIVRQPERAKASGSKPRRI
jgi:GAF domain-containing protein/CheY-like chemotaxis protein